MDTEKPSVKNPGRQAPLPESFENRQLRLFQDFLCNTEEQRDSLSNTVDLWDAVPKYYMDRSTMKAMRHPTERTLPVQEREFQYQRDTLISRIFPARIETPEGYAEFLPGMREELVEDALRKLASDPEQGFLEGKSRSGVVFTLYQLRKELRKRQHAMSYQQVIESLHILAGCRIEIISSNRKRFSMAPILPVLSGVSREDYAANLQAKWFCEFYPLVTISMHRMTYRQFDYHRMMQHHSQLARWLHKRLSHNYTNASFANLYEIKFSTVQNNSGLLDYGQNNTRGAVTKLQSAFDELVTGDVLSSFEVDRRLGPRNKVLDALFTLTPSRRFIAEVKAAHRRAKENAAKISSSPDPIKFQDR